MLGRDDIGALAPGMAADFVSFDLSQHGFAGALHDPVAAVVFCATQTARHTVVNGKQIVKDGEIVTMDMQPVIATHNRCAARLLEG